MIYKRASSLYPLLSCVVFLLSCGSPSKSQSLKDSASTSAAAPIGHPKLVKTQGTTKYANIHCSLMDKAGNLWFGTTGEGVYRYDGKLFTQYTVSNGLSSNTVWSMLEDNAGNIWFGTDTSISRYDGKTITSIPISAIDPTLNIPSEKNEVWSILQDRTGLLWFGTTSGIYRYDGKTFTRFLDDPAIINIDKLTLKSVQCMLEDKKGVIWFGSGPLAFEGLCRYDGKSLINTKPGGETWIRRMQEDRNGTIWLGMRHKGVWRYDGNAFTQWMEGGDDNGLAMLEDSAGNMWFSGGEKLNGIGNDGGLSRYDGKSFTKFPAKNGLGDYSVWSMVEDRAGNIWIGTRNIGLYRYDGKTFTDFTENESK